MEGSDRYSTAAAVALAVPDYSGIRVVLASGEDFPDALAASAAAGYYRGPVLLTPRDRLHPAAASALEQLDPYEVVIIGGPAAVGTAVDDELRRLGHQTFRTAGRDRYETATTVAESMSDSGCHCPPWNAVLVSGEVFADAVAAGPILYGSSSSRSVLLTRRDELPDVTREHLRAGVRDVVIVGGTDVVSAAVEDEIRAMCQPRGPLGTPGETCMKVERVAGRTRQETAVAVAEYAYRELNWTPDRVVLSNGTSFADALVAGRYANINHSASLLTVETDDLGGATREFLERHQSTVARLDVVGDETAVTAATANEARSAARGW